MGSLPKHLQVRYRYLGVGIESWPDADISRDRFQQQLWYAAQNLLGDAAAAELALSVRAFEHRSGAGEAIVRTRRGTVDRARAALACLAAVDGAPVGLRVRGVSGTRRACEERYMHQSPQFVAQRAVVFGNSERSGTVRDGRVDIQTDDGVTGAATLELEAE